LVGVRSSSIRDDVESSLLRRQSAYTRRGMARSPPVPVWPSLRLVHNGDVTTPTPVEIEEPDVDDVVELENPWVTIVWNDPVNLMSYVAYVFRNYFGYTEEKATELMLAVHHEGKAIVSSGSREQMERHVQAMHEYGLWATLQRADE
jgi:ATP-dependent Clp protease adaptor protein ClpS